MFFLGCHMIDFILQIKGAPERIECFNYSSGINGITSIDFGMAVLCYNDCHCIVKVSANEVGGRRHLVVSGSEKTVVIDPIEGGCADKFFARSTEYELVNNLGNKSVQESEPFDRYDDMMYSFGQMALGERKNPWDYDYEYMLYKTIHECCR